MSVYDRASVPKAPRCRAYTSSYSLANNVVTAIPLDAEELDSHSMHDNATNNTRITVPTGQGGLWHVGGYISWPGAGNGVRSFRVRKNGSFSYAYQEQYNDTGVIGGSDGNSDLLELAAGDYVEVTGWQTSGASQTISAYLWAYRVSS